MDDSLFEALDRIPSRAAQGTSYFNAPNSAYSGPRAESIARPLESFETRPFLAPTQRYEEDVEPPTPYSYDEPLEFNDRAQGLVRNPARALQQAQPLSHSTRMPIHPTQNDGSMYGHMYDDYQKGNQHRLSGYENVYRQPGASLDDGPSASNLPSSPAYQASQRRTSTEKSVSQSKLRQSTKYDHAPSGQQPRAAGPLASRTNSHGRRPIAQGIELIPVADLPDRFRSLFSFLYFNAVQSRCFEEVYGTYHNFVLSSPTGSGKTVIFELAICQLVHQWHNGAFKVVYMAPTKALCAERKRDWKSKFDILGLECEELTGDSDIASLKNVQTADIIITTPEKWDSMTRKWKDHEKLVSLIKLFLVDEVHILGNDRGAALEAVISRMKSMGSNIRFVALSATVPNFHDIAIWLGRDQDHPSIPASCEKFGEEFRPVRLQKHVCGYQASSNVFAFDSTLTKKLPDVISKYSRQKPIMVFCFTRKSCSEAAKHLANWWSTASHKQRYWPAPRRVINVENKELRDTVSAGVAVHHGGLVQADRLAVEKGYLEGDINIICCTSTLSVGVNLPCHMVVIKNTSSYEGNTVKEYSDLDIMQMMGRAGRPQFDDSAVAVIMTRMLQVARYEQMVSGQEQLESCLHLNLIEHMNAEIGLGTVTDLHTAKRWLKGTFLRVRLQENPRHYRIEGDSNAGNLDERLDKICAAAVVQLTENDLVRDDPRLRLSDYGEAMARYYINIDTMIAIMDLAKQPRPSEILSTIAQAYEFREIRLRSGEKQLYKDLNASPNIRFPMKVDIALPAHKVSLLIQSILGGADDIVQESNHRAQYSMDQGLVFQHVHRLIRCMIDCLTYRQDAVGVRNALFLSRSFSAKVWDDSPYVLRQIDGIGPVAVKKLVSANINNFEDVEHAEPGRLERALSKNPTFVHKLLVNVKTFPKLRISVQLRSKPLVKAGEHVTVNLAVELGFLNDQPPRSYQNKPVFVIILAETSDGHMLQFSRISASQLVEAAPILFKAHLKRPTQFINCYAMCDGLAGTLRQVRLDPKIPIADFRSIEDPGTDRSDEQTNVEDRTKAKDTRQKTGKQQQVPRIRSEDWDDGGLDDQDFVKAAEQDTRFTDIDDITDTRGSDHDTAEHTVLIEPVQLQNGKWKCGHPCRDRAACKHLCCKEGVDKKPKPKKSKANESTNAGKKPPSKTQTKLNMTSKKDMSDTGPPSKKNALEHVDLSQDTSTIRPRNAPSSSVPKSLLRLHEKTVSSARIPVPDYQAPKSYQNHDQGSDMDGTRHMEDEDRTFDYDFDDSLMDNLPDPSELMRSWQPVQESTALSQTEDYSYTEEDPDLLDALLIGAEDSTQLKELSYDRIAKPDEPLDSGVGLNASRPSNNSAAWPSSESGLFVSQPSLLADSSSGGDIDTGLSKRRAEDEDLLHSGAKRVKSGAVDDAPGKTLGDKDPPLVLNNNTTDTGLLDPSVSKDLEMEELRAWVAAEFGDSVELVESMEEAENT